MTSTRQKAQRKYWMKNRLVLNEKNKLWRIKNPNYYREYVANLKLKYPERYPGHRINSGSFKKGLIPWCKDLKGIHLSPRSEFKRGQTTGSKNSKWKGGITPINEKIRKSIEYREWRMSVFERDKFTCQGQGCGQVGGDLQVDHIKPFAFFPELRFKVSNGRTLCIPCHRKTDTYGYKVLKYEQFKQKTERQNISQMGN